MHDLAGLVEHLHLFLCIAIGLEHINLWNDIISQLVGELLDGLHLASLNNLLVLLLQLLHGSSASTRGTLIGCDVDAADMAKLLQGLKHYHHHDRRAVGIGNNATWPVQSILRIALGHHQGHIIVHAERTGVVDHHTAVFRNGLSKFL